MKRLKGSLQVLKQVPGELDEVSVVLVKNSGTLQFQEFWKSVSRILQNVSEVLKEVPGVLPVMFEKVSGVQEVPVVLEEGSGVLGEVSESFEALGFQDPQID